MYLSNCSSSRGVGAKTPQEAWSGRKSSVSHLRVFGNISYINVFEGKRTKLDDRSEKLICIGYDISSKGYKLYNPTNGKTVISRDVEFDKEGTWDWNTQDEDYNTMIFFGEEEDPRREDTVEDEEPHTPIHSSVPL